MNTIAKLNEISEDGIVYYTLGNHKERIDILTLQDSDILYLFEKEDIRKISLIAGKHYHFPLARKKPKDTYALIPMLASIYAIIYFCSTIVGASVIKVGSIYNFNIVLPIAVIVYSFIFLIDSIVTEIYNIDVTRRMYMSSALVTVFFLLLLFGISYIPKEMFLYENQKYLQEITNTAFQIIFASLISFIVSQTLNAYVLSSLKYKAYCEDKKGYNKYSKIYLRFIVASIFATFIDSFLFCFIVFYSQFSYKMILSLIICQFVIKVGIDAFFSFFSVPLCKKIKNRYSIDVIQKPEIKLI